MELTEKQQQLFEFVKFKHGEQKRKYTGEPYYNHLLNVAEIVSKQEAECIEIALCHDLFEDTNCTFNDLYKKLIELGYNSKHAYNICTCVNELTDKFTKEDFPYLNRTKRKYNECNRLATISYKSKSVKYADLIDNTSSIAEYDKDFAKIYLKEKHDILEVMNNGNSELFDLCKRVLSETQLRLSLS